MSVQILGCRLDDVDAAEATEQIMNLARSDSGAQVVTLGTEMAVYAQRNPEFRRIVNAAALSVCDTVGLLMVARRRGAALRERVTGVELIEHLCAAAAQSGELVYFLGGAPGIAQRAAAELERRYPGLRVAGTRDGFFPQNDSERIAQAVRESGARLLFVGLGSPRQEFWISKYARAAGVGAAIGVGGSFDVVSGNVERAPAAWRNLNLEWLYRLVREPRRWRRQLALPYFVWLVTLESFFGARSRGEAGT